MSGIMESIKKRLNTVKEEKTNGRYDNAESELNIIQGIIEKELEKIGQQRTEQDILKIADYYRLAEELNSYLGRVRREIEEVRIEKQRSKIFSSIRKEVLDRNVMSEISDNMKMIEEFRDRERTITDSERFLRILRRWNSYTPLLCLKGEENMGGGYFLAWKGKGIAIDPGISFIRNALSAGLSIRDIDIVVLTHSHVDHTSDFEGIVTLYHEINEPRYNEKLDPLRISLFASIGAFNKYTNLISLSYDLFDHISILSPTSSYLLFDSLKMTATPCKHNDLFCSHPSSCVGLKFYSEDRPIIAISSDTAYEPKIRSSFSDFRDRLVILHIGGIKEEELDFQPVPSESVYEFHLGLRGVMNFVFDIKPNAVIISEFGEEFRGKSRSEIAEVLEGKLKVKVLPADIGLSVSFTDEDLCSTECNKCGKKLPINDVKVTIDSSSNLVYLCPDCS